MRRTTQQDTGQRLPARGVPSAAWNRLKPISIDPLEVYDLPSKGETRLHDSTSQEEFYSRIRDRYMKFCASRTGGQELNRIFASLSLITTKNDGSVATKSHGTAAQGDQSTIATLHERSAEMSRILMAMRKLREGILASHRVDKFAKHTYIFIIHAGVLTRHWETYRPALHYLLHEIQPVTPLTNVEMREFSGYLVLDLACRQNELFEARMQQRKYQNHDRKLATILTALVHDDWVKFWRVKHAVDGYNRAIIEFADARVRTHALKCLGRSYLSAEKSFVERCADASWSTLVESGVAWESTDADRIMIRRPKVL